MGQGFERELRTNNFHIDDRTYTKSGNCDQNIFAKLICKCSANSKEFASKVKIIKNYSTMWRTWLLTPMKDVANDEMLGRAVCRR